jgi:hypothetical protein
MPNNPDLPFRWFIFKPPTGGVYGSFSRDENEALAEVQKGFKGRNRGSKKIGPTLPTFTRDTEAEARANAALFNHVKVSAPALTP